MNIDDKITIHDNLVKNLGCQKEMHEQIALFKSKIQLKKTDSRNQELSGWPLSELETKLNEYKDLLHGYETVYREQLNKLSK